jgi:hypothetical protein
MNRIFSSYILIPFATEDEHDNKPKQDSWLDSDSKPVDHGGNHSIFVL